MVVVAVFVYPSVEIFFFISKTDRDLGNNYKLVVIDSWAELGGNNTHADTLLAIDPQDHPPVLGPLLPLALGRRGPLVLVIRVAARPLVAVSRKLFPAVKSQSDDDANTISPVKLPNVNGVHLHLKSMDANF